MDDVTYRMIRAHRIIDAYFPDVKKDSQWTEDGKCGVVADDEGRITMLDAAGRPRKEKPHFIKFSLMLRAYRTADAVANRLDS